MESGLEDRNNLVLLAGVTTAHPVSMESGLEDRNNELHSIARSYPDPSQWSPA